MGASVSPQMRGRFAVASIHFALVLAIVLWALSDIAMTQREGIEYFIKMDCNRIGSFRPAAVLVMSGFFLTAILLRPKKNVVSSMAHRALFSKVGLFLVCAYTVVAASIGYPQGLCDVADGKLCTCGMCAALEAPERGPDVDFQKNASCSARENGNSTPTHGANNATCENGEGVEPAIICSMKNDQPRGNKIVLGTNISGNIPASTVAQMIDTLTNFLEKYSARDGELRDFNSLPKADESCEETQRLECPNWAVVPESSSGRDFLLRVLLPNLPMMCDKFYGYCDKSNALRRACPETTCCRMCNGILNLNECKKKVTQFLHSELNINSNVEIQDLLSRLNNFGVPPAFMVELETTLTWIARTLTFVLNESMADGANYTHRACSQQCKEQARQAQWYGDSDCLPTAERSWDLNDTKNGKGPRNGTENGEASRTETCLCDAHARAWSRA